MSGVPPVGGGVSSGGCCTVLPEALEADPARWSVPGEWPARRLGLAVVIVSRGGAGALEREA